MCDAPHQEYPRPQMVRENWLNLNGMFDYAITDENAEWFTEPDGKIRVPFAIESCLSGVCKRVGKNQRLWYKKTFTLPESFKGKRVLIHFGAIDWESKIYVNKKLVASHIGGYCPISADITDALESGENELVVWVYDPTDEGWQNRGKQASFSHGFWYTSTTGIWQTVWLEAVPESYIEKYKLTPDIDKQPFPETESLKSPFLTGKPLFTKKRSKKATALKFRTQSFGRRKARSFMTLFSRSKAKKALTPSRDISE